MRALACLVLAAFTLKALPPPPRFHLPDDAVPRKHTVELTIDPNRDIFEGVVRIELEILRTAPVLWVHAKGLTPLEATLASAGETRSVTAAPAGSEFLGIELDPPAAKGPATLTIRYRGRLDDKSLAGPYRRKLDGDWYVYTTFTAIDARRAFPCFDQPRYKTPWEISLRVPRDQKAFSNGGEIEESEQPQGFKLVRFAPTEPLPAEVVAFAVGPFDVFDGGVAGAGTPIRVIAPRGKAMEGFAAAEATRAVLPRLEAYTGIPYPFGKLDHVALAEGAFGAVENPGLITYRARQLLIGPGEANAQRERSVRAIEAHEMAHQWFGDLVTQADWSDVWLSEGFATWLADKVMDEEDPPDRAHVRSIAEREGIMAKDSERAVRVVFDRRVPPGDFYHRIVYTKAASILMMLEAWLGETPFRQALRTYLAAHRFGNAATEDLARVLQAAAGPDPSKVMSSFLDFTGIPDVRTEVDCDRGKLRLLQQSNKTIPVCWKTDAGVRHCDVLDSASRELDLSSCPAWVYPNAGGTGYYRTVWSAAQLARLEPGFLTPAERLTLVYDLRAQKTDRTAARGVLARLASDPVTEVANAAREALK